MQGFFFFFFFKFNRCIPIAAFKETYSGVLNISIAVFRETYSGVLNGNQAP